MKKLILGLGLGFAAALPAAQDWTFQQAAYFQVPATSMIKASTDSMTADGRDRCLQSHTGCTFTGYELVKLDTFHQVDPAIIATFVFHYNVD